MSVSGIPGIDELLSLVYQQLRRIAQGTNLHHFKRSRCMRLEIQRIQDWIICTIQNTKFQVKHSLVPNS